MLFASAAAAAVAATNNPIWILGGAYSPDLSREPNSNGLHVIDGDNGGPSAEISGEALTVAIDVVEAYAVLLTLGFTLVIFFFLAFCVCAKKDDSYDEYELSQGITTVKFCHDGGENGVSLIPRLNGSGSGSMKATDETSESSSRYTMKRELPAIPTNGAGGQVKRGQPTSQHSIDSQGSSGVKLIGGVQVLPAGAVAPGGRAAVVKEAITSPEGDKPKKEICKSIDEPLGYAKVMKSQPYSVEHQYSKFSNGSEAERSKIITHDKRKIESETKTQSSSYVCETKQGERKLLISANKKPLRMDSSEGSATTSIPSSILSTSTHSSSSTHSTVERSSVTSPPNYQSSSQPPQSQTSVVPPIQAAMAISGNTRANEEMPYMTPPQLQPTNDQQQSQYFSGDSQDSRGYTSISVREPLAALKARQAQEGAIAALGRMTSKNGSQTQGPEGEGYYMTVSDDSADETYACIYEGSRGTGSETYAQIEPRNTSSSQTVNPSNVTGLPPVISPTAAAGKSPVDPSPPAPPSVDSLKHVVHSRQASAGSSTGTGMGSPVAEKRGTRSPLPPLPQGDTLLYSPPDASLSSSQIAPKSPQSSEKQPIKSLDEMYAKVNKKTTGHSRGNMSGGSMEGVNLHQRSESSERRNCDKSALDMTHSMVETRTHDSSSNTNRAKSCEVSSSWGALGVGDKKLKPMDKAGGNYETIPSLYSGSDPGYETVKNGEPPYASVDPAENYPGYETLRDSDLDSEPGYETLKHKEIEPGYETLSEVTSKKRQTNEPGYGSLKSEPGYESVLEKRKPEYDPGYEELAHPIVGKALSENDPNYEQLRFAGEKLGEDNGYEVLQKSIVESNYESVSEYDTQTKPQLADGDSSMPLYAQVKKKGTKEEKMLRQGAISDPEVKQSTEVSTDVIGTTGEVLKYSNHVKEESLLDFGLGSEVSSVSKEQLRLSKSGSGEGQNYLVMDSPEEVELPPPGEDDNHRVSSGSGTESMEENKLSELLATGAAGGESIMDLIDIKENVKVGGSMKENGAILTSIDDLLPPPPLPILSDDVTASPPPPPPPVLDELTSLQDFPPPPLTQKYSEEKNSVSSDTTASMCSQIPLDLPPPPLPASSDGFMDESCVNGGVHVTVNPMADLDAKTETTTEGGSGELPSPAPERACQSVPPPPPSPIISGGESGDSSGSTVNGTGSVESVVTVDPKSGTDPTTIPAAPPPLQHSISTSSSDSKQSEPAEGITPV